MKADLPRMMPGQEPYTDEELKLLQRLLVEGMARVNIYREVMDQIGSIPSSEPELAELQRQFP